MTYSGCSSQLPLQIQEQPVPCSHSSPSSISSGASKIMGGEAQVFWSGSDSLYPAQAPTVILRQASFPGWPCLGPARWDQRAG